MRTQQPIRTENRRNLIVYIFLIENVEHEVISDELPVYRGGSFYPEKKTKKKRGKDAVSEHPKRTLLE